MPRAVKPKIPTIARRHSWPSWARWFAVDSDGEGRLFEHKPTAAVEGFACWVGTSRDREDVIEGRIYSRELENWTNSLRRIVPAKARK